MNKKTHPPVKEQSGRNESTGALDSTQVIQNLPSSFDSIRENIEAVLVALVLALIIRHFSVEAFEIPTGSMAPTLYGIHAWIDCPNCEDFSFNVGLREDQLGRARRMGVRCPNCEHSFVTEVTPANRTGGHKILVNKFAYKIGKPRRFDVIVFQMNEERNYIKRLLGLPGERVSIRAGDLYVAQRGEKEFRIVRKIDRPDVREALWFPVNDSDIVERGLNPKPAWKEVFEKGSGLHPPATKWWAWKDQSWTVNAPKDRVALLEFNRNCKNTYNYNGTKSPSGYPAEVGDKRVVFTVTPTKAGSAGKGWIGAELRDGNFTYQCRIPVGPQNTHRKATLRRLPKEPRGGLPDPNRLPPEPMKGEAVEAAVTLPLLKPSSVTVENADDRIAVSINGEEILVMEYVSRSPNIRAGQHYLRLLASDVLADLKSIQVSRDIYHINAARLNDRKSFIDVSSVTDGGENATNRYFPCGDNSPSSHDGRMWGTVPERNLMGRAFFIFWPAWPTNFQCGYIR